MYYVTIIINDKQRTIISIKEYVVRKIAAGKGHKLQIPSSYSYRSPSFDLAPLRNASLSLSSIWIVDLLIINISGLRSWEIVRLLRNDVLLGLIVKNDPFFFISV